MTWFLAALIVAIIGAVAVVAAGKGAGLQPADVDQPDLELPADGPITGTDLRTLRFNTAVRGYRMAEVDALLDRLADQLDHGPSGR